MKITRKAEVQTGEMGPKTDRKNISEWRRFLHMETTGVRRERMEKGKMVKENREIRHNPTFFTKKEIGI